MIHLKFDFSDFGFFFKKVFKNISYPLFFPILGRSIIVCFYMMIHIIFLFKSFFFDSFSYLVFYRPFNYFLSKSFDIRKVDLLYFFSSENICKKILQLIHLHNFAFPRWITTKVSKNMEKSYDYLNQHPERLILAFEANNKLNCTFSTFL